MLFKNLYLLGVKIFQATPTKQDLGTSTGFFQIYDEHPRPFYILEFLFILEFLSRGICPINSQIILLLQATDKSIINLSQRYSVW